MKKVICLLILLSLSFAVDFVNKDLTFPVVEPNYFQGKIVLSDWCSNLRTEIINGVSKTYRYMAWNVPARPGSQIVAPCDGRVEYTNIGGFEGGIITLRIDDRTTITLCHVSKILVTEIPQVYYDDFGKHEIDCSYVKRGQPIALVGQSGRTTGSHVRIRIEVDGNRAFFNSTTFLLPFEAFEYRKDVFDSKKAAMYR